MRHRPCEHQHIDDLASAVGGIFLSYDRPCQFVPRASELFRDNRSVVLQCTTGEPQRHDIQPQRDHERALPARFAHPRTVAIVSIDGAQRRIGTGYAITAYAMWGLFPLYWPLLKPAGAWEILANRVWWSFAFLAVVATFRHGWKDVAGIAKNRRTALTLIAAAAAVTVNWGLYIWAVNSHHVVETALGYFINPLVSVALGMVVLKERLRPLQWVAISIAAAAVAVLTVDYGRLPWIALVLAVSFGTYGLLKKIAAADAFASLTFETTVLAPLSLTAMLAFQFSGHSTFATEGPAHSVLLALTGAITAIPLLFFGAGARRIPLTTIGILQYIAPVIQFTIGITIAGEHMPASRWFGFAAVWLALVVFGFDAYRRAQDVRSTT